jgi:teichoic acid transport system permease protein
MAVALARRAPRSNTHGLRASLRRLYERRETVRYLVTSQLRAGHRDKVLGNLWNLLDPTLFVGVYFVVFGLLFQQRAHGHTTEFILYLSVGVLAWRFHGSSISQGANCVRGNRGLIHEISFPKAVFPIAICLSRLYDFLWGLLIVAMLTLVLGNGVTIHWLWLPLLVLLQLLFTVGVAFVVAYLGAFYADTVNIVDVGMRLWFYMSPIFYKVRGERSIIPEKYHEYLWVYMLNPTACFFESYRDALLWGRMPEPHTLVYVGSVAVVVALLGFAIFARGEGSFAKYV